MIRASHCVNSGRLPLTRLFTAAGSTDSVVHLVQLSLDVVVLYWRPRQWLVKIRFVFEVFMYDLSEYLDLANLLSPIFF